MRSRFNAVIALIVSLALAAGVTAAVFAPAVGAQTPPAVPTQPVVAEATLPPELVVLAQKMSELTFTSVRFSETTSTIERHPHRHQSGLGKLFGGGSLFAFSGEVTNSPPAGNLVLTLFGQPLTLRIVGSTTYLYIAALGVHDGGRPWVKLGPGGLGAFITGKGNEAQRPPATGKTTSDEQSLGTPALAEPPFVKLRKLLAGARTVRELGPATVDGQPVTRFLAVLNPSQLESSSPTSQRTKRQLARLRRRLHLSPIKRTVTLEVSLASSGLPVRTVIAVHEPEVTSLVTLDIPAVDFPLTIEAPPAAQTIGVAELEALEKSLRAHARKHKRVKVILRAAGS